MTLRRFLQSPDARTLFGFGTEVPKGLAILFDLENTLVLLAGKVYPARLMQSTVPAGE